MADKERSKSFTISVENSETSDRTTSSSLPRDVSSSDEISCDPNYGVIGAQFADKQIFKDKIGQRQANLIPLVVDFKRLFSSTAENVLPEVPNRELLHAVVGLYDVSLSEMTPDVLYSTVCEKWARTLILVRDVDDVVKELHSVPRKGSVNILGQLDEHEDEEETKENGIQSPDRPLSPETRPLSPGADGEKDVYVPEESEDSPFAGVFSDEESDENEEEEGEQNDDPDYSEGINAFIRLAKKRRRALKRASDVTYHVGIEKRLVACCTFDKTYCKSERVVHLTLIAVRKKYRSLGIGRFLLSQVKEPTISGLHGAVVVHADNSAVEFFERYGFTDDVILNSKWSDLAEQFTNCTMMSYLPPFTGSGLLGDASPELDIAAMELEMKKWRQKSLDAYTAEITLATRLRNEIIHLRALVASQKDLIEKITADNERLTQEKLDVEKEFLKYRYAANKSGIDYAESTVSSRAYTRYDEGDGECLSQSERKDSDKEMSRQAKAIKNQREARRDSAEMSIIDRTRYVVYSKENQEPYDHMKDAQEFYRLTEEFKSAMKKDPISVKGNHEVKLVVKATLPSSVKERYSSRCSRLREKVKLRLYYCGGLEDQGRIGTINKQGFSEKDVSAGEYGRGLYFSQYPSRAAHFSALNKLLIAEVAIGKVMVIDTKDHTRASAPQGYDSVLTPGRLSHSSTYGSKDPNIQVMNQEYIVFDVNQILPLNILEYSSTRPADKPSS